MTVLTGESLTRFSAAWHRVALDGAEIVHVAMTLDKPVDIIFARLVILEAALRLANAMREVAEAATGVTLDEIPTPNLDE
jgi:hypothetical protein